MTDGLSLGRQLARRHASSGRPSLDRPGSLLNHSELSRTADWSLRSSLTRLAQPHPVLAGRVLDQVRRVDYALSHLQRDFEEHLVVCDRRLGTEGDELGDPHDPYSDGRTADVARLIRMAPSAADALIAGYEAEAESAFGVGERHALPLLVGVLELDALAEIMAAWASQGPEDPPVRQVEASLDRLTDYLERLGVPHDTGPAWSGRRGARSEEG